MRSVPNSIGILTDQQDSSTTFVITVMLQGNSGGRATFPERLATLLRNHIIDF